MERQYIKTGNVDEIISIMSEDNAIAADLLHRCLHEFASLWNYIEWLLIMDDMNIRGNQLQIAYENYAMGDIKMLVKGIENRDSDMVDLINSAYVFEERACLSGAERPGKIVLSDHSNEIWLIDTSWQVKYRFGSEAEILVSGQKGSQRISSVKYLNDYFILIDNSIMHIWEFANVMETKQYHYVPALPRKGIIYQSMLYHPPKTKREKKQLEKMLNETLS